jgi:hypothetical protein|tara:strand:+ start:2760 stop:2864 length:105 start_codon:yes stop_codon:yes gene_type:complete
MSSSKGLWGVSEEAPVEEVVEEVAVEEEAAEDSA